jgi:hypothetical protein
MVRAAGKSGRVESIFGLVNASLAKTCCAEFVAYTAELANDPNCLAVRGRGFVKRSRHNDIE